MGGSSANQQQTTQTLLSPQQQSYINMGQGFANQYAANQPTLPSAGTAIAPFTGPQQQGQQMALDAAEGAQQTIANNAAGANKFLTTGEALAGPNANPFLAQAIQGAVLPARQKLQMETLPGIRQQATGVGGMGNSREGVAEGVATGLESQGEQATGATMENQAYNTGITAMIQALQGAPGTAALQTTPAATTSAVGDVQQQLEQALRSYTTQANLFGQEQPLATAEALTGMGAAIPGATTVSTGQTTQNPSALQYGVGGASILGSLFGGSNPALGTSLTGLGSKAASGLSSLLGDAGSAAGSAGSTIASWLPMLFGAAAV